MNSQMPIEFTIAPRARAAIKGRWATALPMGFLTGLLYTILQVVMEMNLTPSLEKLNVLLEQGYPAEYVLQWSGQTMTPVLIPVGILMLLSAVITPTLNLGMHTYALKLLRGEEGRLADILSRLPIFFKALGLSIMVQLRIYLWTMLGVAVYMFIAFFVLPTGNAQMYRSMLMALAFPAMLPGMIAAFRYMMAEYAMANEPSCGIREAIRISKRLTHKRKLRLVTLLVGWASLSYLGGAVLQMFLGPVFGMALGMLVSLACSVYIEMLKASFYITYRELEEQLT